MKVINRNALKYIAIVAMLIDHIAWAFVPTGSVLGQVMHFFGRLTGPTMAYMLYEGYIHTKNVKKYAIRL
nr:conjugal transfer protein TraX [Lachnospiraceae bacterium]MCR5618746.1 conjugal transfer protein TraX [Lachnospiraceae bacterium]